MRSYGGDIPKDHRNLIEELERLEDWFYTHEKDIPCLQAAKGLVMIAHDYFVMEIEEEGDRIFKSVESKCPGYFKGPIYSHMEKDGDYTRLVSQLKYTEGASTMRSLGFIFE